MNRMHLLSDMKTYECSKTVDASPMTCGEYVKLYKEDSENMGWPDLARFDPEAAGYLVAYDQGKFLSWQPKEIFEKGYNLSIDI